MSEWKKVKLGDILQIKKGDYITKKDAREGIYPVILGGKEPAYYIDKYNHTGKAIVVSRSGASAGFVSFWNEPIFVTDGFLIEPKENITFEFLYYALKSKQALLHNAQKGAAIPHVTPLLISDIDFLLPNEKSRHRIASILSRYDSLIENYQKQIKLLEEAAQRLYKEWFVDLHFPGHENTKIVDGVPEGWEKKRVGDITPIKTGKKDANFGTSDGAYPFFTCSQIPIKAPSYSFDTSAVILAGNGDFNVKLYRGKFEAYQRTYVLEPINEKMLYLLYFCISENMNRLATGASGSTIKFLTKGMIESLIINKPSTIVLDSFNQIIEPIRTQKENLQTQIRLLTEARDRLLPKLMNGEIQNLY